MGEVAENRGTEMVRLLKRDFEDIGSGIDLNGLDWAELIYGMVW